MKSKFILFIFVFICFTLLFLSFKDYQSAKVQYLVINELNSGGKSLKRSNYELLMNLDKSFPNLSATALPMYSVQALYDNAFGDIKSALVNAIKARGVNPYLMFNESILAEIYKKIGLKDSAHFYSKKAYNNLPGSGKHFLQYANTLIEQNNFQELIPEYFNSKFKGDINFKKVILGAVIGKNLISKRIDSMAVVEQYSKNDELRLLSLYVLHDKELVKSSFKSTESAKKYVEINNYDKAIELYKTALSKNPFDFKSTEELAFLLILQNKHIEAIKYFKKIIENKYTKKTDAFYGLGFSYYTIGDNINACKYLEYANNLNSKKAQNLYGKICSN